MGEQYDLAVKMVRLCGYVPHEEIKIEYIGLRPGEKLYEELLVDPKTQRRTANDKIFIENCINEYPDIDAIIKEILPKIDILDNGKMKELIQSLVKAYKIDKRD